MIETGNTSDEKAKSKIIRRYKQSEHKRKIVPIYEFERKNFLREMR